MRALLLSRKTLAKEVFQPDALVRFRVSIFDDDGSVQRQIPTLPGRMGERARAGHDNCFFRNHERTVIRRCMNLFVHQIIHSGGAVQYYAAAQYRAALYDDALIHAAIPSDHHLILNNHRHGADRLENATDLRACGDVTISSDLRAASDQCVRIDHRAVINIRSGIYEHRGHARNTTSDIRAVANAGSTWNNSYLARETYIFNRIGVLIEKRLSLPVDRHIYNPAHPKSDQDAFLYPRVYAPARFRSCIGLGRAHFAAIQRGFEGLKCAPVIFRVLRRRRVEELLNLRRQHRFSRRGRASQGQNGCVPRNLRSAAPAGGARRLAANLFWPWRLSPESGWIPRNLPPSVEDSASELHARPENSLAARNCRDWPFPSGFHWRPRKSRHARRVRKAAT